MGDIPFGVIPFGIVIILGIWYFVLDPIINGGKSRDHDSDRRHRK